MNLAEINPEHQAAKAFTKQSGVFDGIYSANTIIQYKRGRVWEHVNRFLAPNSRILELNSGTGEDAVYFASQGHLVHATDISEGMQKVLRQKIQDAKLEKQVSAELCSFTELENLGNKGPYDLIFSNFAGLNCTGQLAKVLNSFSSLLAPNGLVTLVILPRFCLWETLLLFKGKFKTAFRRFFGGHGRKAHIEGEFFLCWYYDPRFIKRQLKTEFKLLSLEGLCTLVPPSYIENFAEKHGRAFQFLRSLENKWKERIPWRSIGDYYIITMQRKS